jgi:hypothetical protein
VPTGSAALKAWSFTTLTDRIAESAVVIDSGRTCQRMKVFPAWNPDVLSQLSTPGSLAAMT